MSKASLAVAWLSALTRRYGDTRALDQAGLEISPYRMVGLFVPDGVGKSTPLAVIVGVRTRLPSVSVLHTCHEG